MEGRKSLKRKSEVSRKSQDKSKRSSTIPNSAENDTTDLDLPEEDSNTSITARKTKKRVKIIRNSQDERKAQLSKKRKAKRIEMIKGRSVGHTEIRKRNDQTPDDIFGYRSKLHLKQQCIFEKDKSPIIMEPETTLEETIERDIALLLQLNQLSSSDEAKNKPSGQLNVQSKDSAEIFSLFWLFISIGGRMPFYFKKSDSNFPTICKLKKSSWNFCAFVLSTILLICLTLISTVNLLIIVEEEDKGDPHNQLEKLLFEKNKVTAFVFLTSLTLATVSSIIVLLHGKAMAKYMTLWANTLNEFKFESGSGIREVTITYIVWFISIFLLQVVLFAVSILNPTFNPFIEGIHLLIAMVFRSFVPNVLIEIDESEILSSPNLWKYGIFIICLNVYTVYCSFNFAIMVVLYAIGIRNIATEWNFRLRLFLEQFDIRESEYFLLKVKESLTYKNIFVWHRKIAYLVEENSKVFCTILATFYLCLAVALAFELQDLSIFTVGRKKLNFSLNESLELYEFDRNNDELMYLCFYLSQTIGFFFFVSFFLAEAGIELMNGADSLRRHSYGFVKTISTHKRNFLMSLSMSLSERRPHLLRVGRLFSIDRPFILSFLALFIYLFSVMIQTQHERILRLPSVIECPPDSRNFCTSTNLVSPEDFSKFTEDQTARAAFFIEKRWIQSIARFARQMHNDSCMNAPKENIHFKLPAVQKAVSVKINGTDFALCCYDYGNGKENLTKCNFDDDAQRAANCLVDPSKRDSPPYQVDDLDSDLQPCISPEVDFTTSVSKTCLKMHEWICGTNPRVDIT